MDSASIGTWVSSEVVSASTMNTHVRDNFLETAPAKATASGFLISDGSNGVVAVTQQYQQITTSETTTSTSFTDLATTGPEVTTTTRTTAMVAVGGGTSNSSAGAGCYMGVAVSGASSVSSSVNRAFFAESAANDIVQATFVYFQSGLTAGSNTFTAEYRVGSGGTGTWRRRVLTVIPL